MGRDLQHACNATNWGSQKSSSRKLKDCGCVRAGWGQEAKQILLGLRVSTGGKGPGSKVEGSSLVKGQKSTPFLVSSENGQQYVRLRH